MLTGWWEEVNWRVSVSMSHLSRHQAHLLRFWHYPLVTYTRGCWMRDPWATKTHTEPTLMHPQLPQPSWPFHGLSANPKHHQSFLQPHLSSPSFLLHPLWNRQRTHFEIKQDHIIPLFKSFQGFPIALDKSMSPFVLFMLFLVMKSLLVIFLGLLHNWSHDIVAILQVIRAASLLAAGWLGVSGGSRLGSLTPPRNTGSCTKPPPYNWAGWLCFVNTILLVPQLN